MADATVRIFRGTREGGETADYHVPIAPGMVVLDALHYVQKYRAPDLAVRWNCKAGKCGSCSAEVNGRPRLTCKTRMDSLPQDQPITIRPMKSFPIIKDLVARVSLYASPPWRCIRWTESRAPSYSRTNLASGYATSPNAAPRFVPKRFTSPTMPSFR